MTPRRGGRLLVISMYELTEGTSGPTVRIRRLVEALRRHVEVEIIDGSRGQRRGPLLRYLLSGRLGRIDAVYVESSNALPSETDLLVMQLAKLLGRPVATYVRDAYRIFPEHYPVNSRRRWLSLRLFPLAMLGLRTSSTRMAFPSEGLARALGASGAPWLLPPGAPEPFRIERRDGARSLLFVGALSTPMQGGETLLRAIELARAQGADVDLICVTRPGDEPEPPWPPWLRIERASSDEIGSLLGEVLATVVPRPPGAYNDLAVPIKLMEYLAYGRPILATPRTETARIVTRSEAGLVVEDGPEGLASGIVRLCAAPEAERVRWSQAAESAARTNSWDARALELVTVLGLSHEGQSSSSAG
jgi:glycosyltransferase involved in cell wall biosynthesis